ncbi:MAG TPA: hypothetical protein VGH88_02135 [Streptosporangiaceae bacterium]
MTHPLVPPPVPPPGPLSGSYDDEVRQARRYERGLALKGLAALAIVALLIAARILWF